MNKAYIFCVKVGTTKNTIKTFEFYSLKEDCEIPKAEDFTKQSLSIGNLEELISFESTSKLKKFSNGI